MSRRNRDLAFTLAVLRDGPTCYICGQPPDADDPLEDEHVIPISSPHGGNDFANRKVAHRSCNRAKGVHAIGEMTG